MVQNILFDRKRLFYIKRILFSIVFLVVLTLASFTYQSKNIYETINLSLNKKVIELNNIVRAGEVAAIRAGTISKHFINGCYTYQKYLDDLVLTTRYINGVVLANDKEECYSSNISSISLSLPEWKGDFFKLKVGQALNPIDSILMVSDSKRIGSYSTLDIYTLLNVIDQFYDFGTVYININDAYIGSNHFVEHFSGQTIIVESSQYPYSLVFNYHYYDLAYYLFSSSFFLYLLFFSPLVVYFFINFGCDDDALLLKEIKNSIKLHHFVPYIQPIVSHDGTIKHAEVLVRWVHPKFGLIPPDDFILLAEESGLIIPITEQIMEVVAKRLCDIEHQLSPEFSISFNVSASHLGCPSIVSSCENFLSHFSRGSILCLELTERELLANTDLTLSLLASIRAMGVKLALDDFGTGFSTLESLMNYEFQIVKIDKSFVERVGDKSASAHIVDSLIELSQKMEQTCIVEGVETEDQVHYFLSRGVDAIQGYFYSKPLTLEEFIRYISQKGI